MLAVARELISLCSTVVAAVKIFKIMSSNECAFKDSNKFRVVTEMYQQGQQERRRRPDPMDGFAVVPIIEPYWYGQVRHPHLD